MNADLLLRALQQLRIDANRLCDRQLGGTYEEDCRRSIAAADAAIAQYSTIQHTGLALLPNGDYIRPDAITAVISLDAEPMYGLSWRVVVHHGSSNQVVVITTKSREERDIVARDIVRAVSPPIIIPAVVFETVPELVPATVPN